MKNIFLFSIVFIFLISSIAAISWPFSKAITCQNFNISGIDCEKFWCNSIQEGNYSIEKEICILKEIINNTIIVNQTIYVNQTDESKINVTLNSSEFYNKSEIDTRIKNLKINFTQKYLLKNDFEDFQDDFDDDGDSESKGITGSEIIIGLLVVSLVVGGFYFVNKKKGNQPSSQRGEAPILQKKIQTPKERELEKKIDELEKKNQKKKSTRKKSGKKTEEEEEFEED